MSADFLDTNVFVYLFDEIDHRKRAIAENIVRSALDTSSAEISYQVIQETLNVLTGKLQAPASDADRFMNDILLPLWHVLPSQRLYRRGIELHAHFHYSFYDSLIIAAAIEAGCAQLLSEDLQHGQKVEGVTILNPFLP
ncbi:MAG: PIN domain-containing protein [Chloroflexota bacterium]